MPEVKAKDVLSFSSEDKKFPAENLLKPEGTSKWKCTEGEKQASVTLQLERASEIQHIDIGNEGSAFVEVLVSRGNDDFKVLLSASVFMTPIEGRGGTNLNAVRMFSSDKLHQEARQEKWDRVKVVCTQPFNKKASYGLSFIKFHSKPVPASEKTDAPKVAGTAMTKQTTLGAFRLRDDGDAAGAIQTGSLFAKRNKEPEKPAAPLTGAAAIRAASKLAEESAPAPSTSRAVETGTKRKSSEDEDAGGATNNDAAKPSLRKQSTSVSSVTSSTTSGKKDAPPPLKKSKTEPPKRKPRRAFDQLMRHVVFCLSGFQNPERGRIRDKAIEMGATYKPDWGRGCTHLVCAYDNTPKYNQVSGKGRIVTKQWIDQCHRKQELVPWRKYRLGDAQSPGETSDSDSDAEKEAPRKRTARDAAKKPGGDAADAPGPSGAATKKPAALAKTGSNVSYGGDTDEYMGSTDEGGDTDDEIQRLKDGDRKKNPKEPEVDPYDVPTDEEDNNTDAAPAENGAVGGAGGGLPDLPSFFAGKTFFLFGTFDASERRTMRRFITAYDGSLVEYMNEKVNYVVSSSKWNKDFDEALSDNSNLVFVKPTWIRACDEQQKLVPHQKFVIAPN